MLGLRFIARFIYRAQKYIPVLPHKFVKHNIVPLLQDGKQEAYNAKAFFDAHYSKIIPREFSDRISINTGCDPCLARYHYNAVENSIIEYFALTEKPAAPHVLDIGSGPGHWIDFYLNFFDAESITGVDIASACVEALRTKYKSSTRINIIEADISNPGLNLQRQFDIINAIGIAFHIVDDFLWSMAIKNIARHLKSNGVALIGGQFGLITRNVEYFPSSTSDTLRVYKRIRSLRLWRKHAGAAGLRIARLVRTKQNRFLPLPENNILILIKPR